MNGALGAITGTIPVAIGAGVALEVTDRAFGQGRHQRPRQGTGRRPRRTPRGACRSSKGRGRGGSGVGFGNFSNVGL